MKFAILLQLVQPQQEKVSSYKFQSSPSFLEVGYCLSQLRAIRTILVEGQVPCPLLQDLLSMQQLQLGQCQTKIGSCPSWCCKRSDYSCLLTAHILLTSNTSICRVCLDSCTASIPHSSSALFVTCCYIDFKQVTGLYVCPPSLG